jgi:excisionase family DNA binding protein
MTSETVDQGPITVTADDVPAARRTAEALRHLLTKGPVGSASIVTDTGQQVEVPASLVAGLQYLASLLAQGDAVTLVPVQRDVSLAEAATLLGVSGTFLNQLLDTGELASHGEGDDRRIRVSDVVSYKQRRSADNRRDLATALAVAQEAGAYD